MNKSEPQQPLSEVPGTVAQTGQVAAASPPADPAAEHSRLDARAHRQLLTGRAARGLDQLSLTPNQLVWRELRKNQFAIAGAIVLVVLYTMAIFAPFLAPYDPQDQVPGGLESASFHPPMRIRFRQANGGPYHVRPFVYGTVQQFSPLRDIVYPIDPSRIEPIHFFVQGAPYRLLFLIPCRTHLYGVGQGRRIFLLGTDEYGRDYLSRLLYGAQISLSVGLVAIFITFTLGLFFGGISGFYGGLTDDLIMRACEILMSIPDFYLLLALAAALPATLSPFVVYLLIIVILSLIGWAGMARIVRGMVLSVREREYVEAARSLGVRDLRLIGRHILPLTFTFAIVAATMAIPSYILAEAGLSFLGLGIREPMASWGNMLSAAQNLTTLEARPWILAPGWVIFVTTLAFNFLGDGLRDALDPKSHQGV